jgi:peptidoglycan/xylan/chitin deacetylase (PgdA/CDA1 family)
MCRLNPGGTEGYTDARRPVADYAVSEMCDCHSFGLSRRRLLGGLAAGLGAAVLAGAARAAPLRCFDAATLAGRPDERLERHATAADVFVMPTAAEPGAPIAGAMAGIVRRVNLPAGDKAIALTFDLCQTRSPIAGYDGAIVDFLRANQVPATFFPAGRWLETHGARAQQLAADPLFVLGNHSFDHPDLHAAAAERIVNEVLMTETSLADTRRAAANACGTPVAMPMRLFRFPYGSCADTGAATVNAIGSVVIQWDVVSGDPDGTSAATITANLLREIKPGSIVVMHANGRGTHTAEALARLVPKLRGEGYRFVTVPELLASGTPQAASECFIERPGDTLRYDDRLAHHAPAELRPTHPAT